MNTEYLLFNIIVLIGPVVFSFDQRVYYFRFWPVAFLSIALVMIPFLAWDIWVNESHWFFHQSHTLPFRLWNLPVEEWLFFISVPFTSLFIWQIIVTFKKEVYLDNKYLRYLMLLSGFLFSFIFFFKGKIYTGLVILSLSLTIGLDLVLKTNLLAQKRTVLFLTVITVLIFIFNGYLTARPVIYYGSTYNCNIKIWTIPIEDFGYGYALIISSTILYEKFKGILYA
jgi:lycopene cyclase domain-containing protein